MGVGARLDACETDETCVRARACVCLDRRWKRRRTVFARRCAWRTKLRCVRWTERFDGGGVGGVTLFVQGLGRAGSRSRDEDARGRTRGDETRGVDREARDEDAVCARRVGGRRGCAETDRR